MATTTAPTPKATPTTADDQPVVVFPFNEPDMRLEDYLDDKLQSTADLDTIDALLEAVEEQHSQLQAQLDDAAVELETARGGADAQRAKLQAQADEFAMLDEQITQQLFLVGLGEEEESKEGRRQPKEAVPEAVMRQLAEPLQQLQRLDLAEHYLELLADVTSLADAARACLPDHPRQALGPYAELRRLAARLQELSQAEPVAPHLVAHVAAAADRLWAEMNKTMGDAFAATLAERRWPQGVDPAMVADETWRDGFARLVDLQVPEIVSTSTSTSTSTSPTLLPLQVMADLFVQEFRYHFLSSSRKTSDPRQIGDLCFPWFLERVEKWADFLRRSFADLLADRFADTSAADKAVYTDPACALVAALLPVMQEKTEQAMDYAVKQLQEQKEQEEQQQLKEQQTQTTDTPLTTTRPFLSRLAVQILEFDDELRTRFGFDGGIPSSQGGWPGLAATVLDDTRFALWLQAEKDVALAQYHGIVDSETTLDYDYGGGGGGAERTTKPTLAAVQLTDAVLRPTTEQWRRLRPFGRRLRFLMDIQVTLLDGYDDRLRGALEAYAAVTSAVGRTLHGVVTTREQRAALAGTGALETLCKVYGSADHVVRTLTTWGDEEVFVGMWEELEGRAEQRKKTTDAKDDPNTSLFDETILSFAQRRQTAQEFLVQAMAESHRKAFRPYVLRVQWTSSEDDSNDAITPELDEPLRVLTRNLAFVRRALGTTAALRRVARATLLKLQDMLWSDVLVVQRFTAQGALQLARDLAAVAAVAEQHVPRSSAALEGLREGVQLLGLPVVASEKNQHILSKVVDRVFTDNAEAKKVLQELGLTTLSPANARLILQRRVEST